MIVTVHNIWWMMMVVVVFAWWSRLRRRTWRPQPCNAALGVRLLG